MVIYKSTFNPVPLPDQDIVSFLFSSNQFNTRYPADRKVTIDGHTGRSLTYAQVRNTSARLAAGWIDNVGLKYGDVVSVFAPNQYDHIVLYLSLLAAKATISPG